MSLLDVFSISKDDILKTAKRAAIIDALSSKISEELMEMMADYENRTVEEIEKCYSTKGRPGFIRIANAIALKIYKHEFAQGEAE